MNRDIYRNGKIQAAPAAIPAEQPAPVGLRALQLDQKRHALLYVPPSYTHAQPAQLAVMLHGAGGNAQQGMSLLQPEADASGIILLAPFSRGGTWDIIEQERFGPDVLYLSQALQQVFNAYVIDVNKCAIGGFSDGASYALSLGLLNGRLFTHILAFSPGFYYAPDPEGKPRIYISHGVHDNILPIAPCSRRIVPQLKKGGYEVMYHEFEGEHMLPGDVRTKAMRWFLNK